MYIYMYRPVFIQASTVIIYIYTYWLAGVQFLKGHFKIHYVFIQIHVYIYIYIFTVIHIYIHKTYPQLGYIISSNHSDQINLSQDGRRLQDHCRGLRKPPSHKVTRPVISSVKVSDFTAQDFRTAHLTH